MEPKTTGDRILGATGDKLVGAVKGVGDGLAQVAIDEFKTFAASSAKLTMMLSPLGILASTVWSVIEKLIGEDKAEKLRHAQNKQEGAATVERDDIFDSQAADVIGDRRILCDSAGAAIDAAFTHSMLDAVESWIQTERASLGPIRTKDPSLTNDLLAHWVLQHSESFEEENNETSDLAYHEACKDKEVRAAIGRGFDLLFAHQLRHGLHRHGLYDPTVCDAIERKARSTFDSKGPDDVVAQTTGLVINLNRVTDAQVFAKAMEKAAGGFSAESFRVPNYLEPAKKQNVRAHLQLSTSNDDGKVVLDELDFRIECIGVDRVAYEEGKSTSQSNGGFSVLDFGWEP